MSWDRSSLARRCLVAVTCSVFGLGIVAAPVAAREFRAADIQEENYPTVLALRYMDQLVTQRTGGRHRIRVFHSRQLGEENQTIEQTRVGAIDMNRINVGPMGNVAPILNVLALPFLFRSVDHLYKVVDGPIGDEILDELESSGLIGLTFYDSGARSIYTTTPTTSGWVRSANSPPSSLRNADHPALGDALRDVHGND